MILTTHLLWRIPIRTAPCSAVPPPLLLKNPNPHLPPFFQNPYTPSLLPYYSPSPLHTLQIMERAKHSFLLSPIPLSCLVMNKICLNQILYPCPQSYPQQYLSPVSAIFIHRSYFPLSLQNPQFHFHTTYNSAVVTSASSDGNIGM